VREFAQSVEITQQRSFALLKVLSLFPQGEQLARVKRFLNNTPFYPKNATELSDAGFLEVTTLQRLDMIGADAQAKTLVVPRSIRECVRELVTIDEIRDLNRKAADLYFGIEWSRGVFKPPAIYRFDNPNCPSGDISNANAIIVRLFNDAHSLDDERGMQRALGLALTYANALTCGDHFQSVVNLNDQLLPNVSDDLELAEQSAKLRAVFGKCLRMTGAHVRALAMLSEIEDYPLPSSTRQSVLLNLALIHQVAEEDEDARNYARKVMMIDRHSNAALQAQTILIELEPDTPKRSERLASHEVKCRRQKATTAANNIAISRAKSAGSPEERRKILDPIMVLSRDAKDHYNQTRAIIELSKLALDEGRTLTDRELSQLINAYHFLFNERLAPIFDRCHDALWGGFGAIDDYENLRSLFRHSSLYWRLRGKGAQEKKYMALLVDNVAQLPASDNTREVSYFRARARAVGLIPASTPILKISDAGLDGH
jgi:hypothetical protein